MLDSQKVIFIQKCTKYISIVLLCTAFIMRVAYCKIQRRKIMFSDEFADINNNVTEINTDSMTDTKLKDFLDFREQSKVKGYLRRNFLTLKRNIKNANNEKLKYNDNAHKTAYGNKVSEGGIVVVIQVHEGDWPLMNLLETLSQAKITASDGTLIFAHDYYDSYLNEILSDTVDFANYMQIFYPFSTQLYEEVFPGNDGMFCDGEYNCEPNQRDQGLAQLKHFWWWHVNHVFENIDELSSFNGYVLFLDYEQVISEDILYIFKLMSNLIRKDCPQCDFISLGAYKPTVQGFKVFTGDMFIVEFGSTDANIGIAFNRTTWKKIKAHARYFCNYNDHKWDESLKYLSTKLPKKLMMLAIAGSRVLPKNYDDTVNFGDCLDHTSSSDRVGHQSIDNNVSDTAQFFRKVHRGLYPRELVLKPAIQSTFNITGHGKWEDARDKELCMLIVDPQMKKLQEIFDM